jgi:hypothetical protein
MRDPDIPATLLILSPIMAFLFFKMIAPNVHFAPPPKCPVTWYDLIVDEIAWDGAFERPGAPV